MQQTIGLKRFVITHLGPTALACGVLVSVALGVAGLGMTGNLPWMADGESRSAQMHPGNVALSPAEHTTRVEQMQQFYAHKEARLEAGEMERSALAALAARQDTMRRYVDHKEETLNALP